MLTFEEFKHVWDSAPKQMKEYIKNPKCKDIYQCKISYLFYIRCEQHNFGKMFRENEQLSEDFQTYSMDVEPPEQIVDNREDELQTRLNKLNETTVPVDTPIVELLKKSDHFIEQMRELTEILKKM